MKKFQILRTNCASLPLVLSQSSCHAKWNLPFLPPGTHGSFLSCLQKVRTQILNCPASDHPKNISAFRVVVRFLPRHHLLLACKKICPPQRKHPCNRSCS